MALWQLTANHQNTFVRIAHFAYCDFDLILSEHFLFVGQMRTQNNLHNFRFSYLGESSFLWIIWICDVCSMEADNSDLLDDSQGTLVFC